METKIKTFRRYNDIIGQKFGNLTVIQGPLDITEESSWKKKQRKWLCKCKCGNEVIRVTNQLNKGTATSCGCQSKERIIKLNTQNCRPYEWIYNNLKRCAINNQKPINLSFDDFLIFTNTNRCHYCNDTIEWKPRNSKKNYSNCYYLDRKDNTKGYSIDNCIVCCSLCNLTRHIRFSYEEMLILGKTIGEIKKRRLENPFVSLSN